MQGVAGLISHALKMIGKEWQVLESLILSLEGGV